MTIPGSVELSPEAQSYYAQVFRPRYESLLQQAKRVILSIFLCGPGKNTLDLYDKRRQICDELRNRHHYAILGEELTPENLYLNDDEFLHAQASELVVLIAASFGSVAELHEFGSDMDISRKMLVFMDQADRGGYSDLGLIRQLRALGNNVNYYKYPEDVERCNLLKTVVERVDVLQMVKYRSQTRRRAGTVTPSVSPTTVPPASPTPLTGRS